MSVVVTAAGMQAMSLCWDLQEAYGRIHLCSTAMRDHFVPAYLVSLESAINSLLAEVQEQSAV